MKDVTLKITGQHLHEGVEEEDKIEFITDGRLYNRNGTIYLLYDESEMSGLDGLKTRLTLKKDSVSMKRSGKAVGVDTEIRFSKGERFKGFYDTDFGPVEFEVLTNDLKNSVTGEGSGSVEIDYNISLKGLAEGRSRMNIEVKS
jgi:uncharacterized beta-barrel protein YwiB (DUF1934 family)